MKKVGVLKNNSLLSFSMGLIPALALTSYLGYGLLLALSAFLIVLFISMILSSFRDYLETDSMRLPVFFIISGTFITLVELVLEAVFPSLLAVFGPYLAILVVGSLVWGYAVPYSFAHRPKRTFFMALRLGAGYGLAVVFISFIRDIMGHGSISFYPFSEMVVELGAARDYRLIVFSVAPGAFFVLAFVSALFRKFFEKRGEE
ncbi:Rnf-Nqr domain containing protein [Spirochaetia bacterium 38H-sp]|uniref:Rnf-Nqr domain containing protein n=1 Tax=Rarispira pelagica TaxID=3141764 RepID=A0ABU9UAE0_9SPIR